MGELRSIVGIETINYSIGACHPSRSIPGPSPVKGNAQVNFSHSINFGPYDNFPTKQGNGGGTPPPAIPHPAADVEGTAAAWSEQDFLSAPLIQPVSLIL